MAQVCEAVPNIREQINMTGAWMMFWPSNGSGLQATDVLSTGLERSQRGRVLGLESNWDADTFL